MKPEVMWCCRSIIVVFLFLVYFFLINFDLLATGSLRNLTNHNRYDTDLRQFVSACTKQLPAELVNGTLKVL